MQLNVGKDRLSARPLPAALAGILQKCEIPAAVAVRHAKRSLVDAKTNKVKDLILDRRACQPNIGRLHRECLPPPL